MDIQDLIKEYTNWLGEGFTAVKFGEFYELTTPYLDRYNDHLQIYVKQNANGSYFLTDDGEIIRNLISAGVSFKGSSKRNEMLNRIARNFGVTVNGTKLEIFATRSDYPQKKHLLIQAMLTIDDMFIAEPNAVKSFFKEDVGLFLDENEIYYSPDFPVMGKTGLYVYDYHFQRTKNRPERFCRAINTLNKTTRSVAIYDWMDTKERRPIESELILFLNDENGVSKTELDALQSYDVSYILWSQRHSCQNLELLAS